MGIQAKAEVKFALIEQALSEPSNLLTITRVTSSMNTAIDAQLNKISDENLLKVQKVFDECEMISQ